MGAYGQVAGGLLDRHTVSPLLRDAGQRQAAASCPLKIAVDQGALGQSGEIDDSADALPAALYYVGSRCGQSVCLWLGHSHFFHSKDLT